MNEATPQNTVKSKPPKFIIQLRTIWGFVFRLMFITVIGFIAYDVLKPVDVGDVPLSDLTLNMLLGRLLAGLSILGCIAWFFSFPQKENEDDEPYLLWAKLGIGVVVLIFLAFLYL